MPARMLTPLKAPEALEVEFEAGWYPRTLARRPRRLVDRLGFEDPVGDASSGGALLDHRLYTTHRPPQQDRQARTLDCRLNQRVCKRPPTTPTRPP